ncbi:hypothetical protein B0H14DRAFT_2376740 [Mycena olivaceomarginata]|nr:hypothetical protein B0H14DRAFT_2391031 [Mycena olivaceomarginata]KAJ7813561.1 hypothetical protein B0H14DRAFT_2376740 [Mycena olivaceomarginata]
MSSRLDFSPFRTHYFFLATTIVAALGWLLAFIFQAIATAQFGHRVVGTLWFAILLQAALNVGVVFVVATDSVQMARLQIAVFSGMATLYAVRGTDLGVFSSETALRPMGAGYMVLAIIDILWVLYFTSEADSLALHLINRLGTGGLAPPTRRKRSRPVSASTTASKPNYALGGGVGSPDMGMHELKRESLARSVIGSLKRQPSTATLKRSGTALSNASQKSLLEVVPPVPIRGLPGVPSVPPPLTPSKSKTAGTEIPDGPRSRASHAGAMLPGIIIVSPPPPASDDDTEEETILRARALHSYKGSSDDPTELSFQKGEVLEIEDQAGKWWQAKKADGTAGSESSNKNDFCSLSLNPFSAVVPSNYLVML